MLFRSLRAGLERECAALGAPALHARLRERDPEAAARISPRDRQRVLRALEIVGSSGRTLAWWRDRPREAPLAAEWRSYELVCPPALLARRIALRTRAMWEQGLLEETRALVEAGREPELRALAAIGCDEALERLAGRLGAEDAASRMNERTRQLAKRQRTWFRHQMATERLESGEASPEAWAERVAAALF